MIDLLQRGSDWLESKRHQYMAHPVLYRRGEASVTLAATVGKTTFEVDDGAGAMIRVESRDYLIRAGDLILGDAVVLPVAGDTIVETLGGQAIVYEVRTPGHEPCYRFSDPYRTTLRVHTQQIDQESNS